MDGVRFGPDRGHDRLHGHVRGQECGLPMRNRSKMLYGFESLYP